MLSNVPGVRRTVFTPVVPEPLADADRAVFDAIEHRDPLALRAALEQGGDPNAIAREEIISDHDSWVEERSPLNEALRVHGPIALDLVNVLLQAGASLEHPTTGHHALTRATNLKRWDLLNRLLDESISPPDEDVENPRSVHRQVLGALLYDAQVPTLTRLINQGWTWHPNPDQDGWLTAFLNRMRQRDPLPDRWSAMLDLCLANDPTINGMRRQHPENTPLTLALQTGHEDLVRAVLACGADVHQPVHQEVWADDEAVPRLIWEDRGITPLHLAAMANRPELCRLLIEHGADVHRRADTAWTKAQASAAWHFDQPLASTDAPLTALDAAQRCDAHAAAALLEREMLLARDLDLARVAERTLRPRSRL